MKVHPLSNVRVNRPNTMPAPWSQPVLTEDGWTSADGIGTLTADHPGALYDAARVMASAPDWMQHLTPYDARVETP